MDTTRWSILKSDWLFSLQVKMEKLYTVRLKKKKKRLGADCSPDHELFIAKFKLILKKVGKTTRPFRYDWNQIPYNYTVEETNRFHALDMIECLKNYGQRFITLYRRLWSKPSPRKRNAKRQNGCLRRPYIAEKREAKCRGEKERYTHLNAEFQRIARRDKKGFLRDSMQRNRGKH